jgi:hypothetical protein
MTKTKRTEIEIETHELKVIRFRQFPETAFCERCRQSVSVLKLEQAAEVLNISLPIIYRLIEREKAHTIRDGEGSSILCSRSLNEIDNSSNQITGAFETNKGD